MIYILIAGNNIHIFNKLKCDLFDFFQIKDLGRLKFFLGLEFSFTSLGSIYVGQRKYALDLLDSRDYINAKPIEVPTSKPQSRQYFKEWKR